MAVKSAQIGVIALMVLASAMMIGNVPIWIWIGSQTTASQQGNFGPYVLIGAGILVTVVVLVLALSRLNRLYERLVGGRRMVRVRMPWTRSMREERSRAAELTVLDTVLISTVLVTVLGFVVWFFAFAGSSLPGGHVVAVELTVNASCCRSRPEFALRAAGTSRVFRS